MEEEREARRQRQACHAVDFKISLLFSIKHGEDEDGESATIIIQVPTEVAAARPPMTRDRVLL
jgi:hypothetical protein